MTKEEQVNTVRNVISDLEVLLAKLLSGEIDHAEFWSSANWSVEYITEDVPHL
jgi:hypothetical protein